MTNELVSAAQYVRMSTEHQQYSLENQSAAIQRYAESHGFSVVQTYSDAARSGLVLRYRKGLQQLLQDVVSGAAVYRAVLVYDISRWGRFQDTDESAHYEFLCRSAGVPIHYCAEAFANDGTLASHIMKALKRTMAGEFSRELGVKVLDGQRRLARLGFKQGGSPGYGMRRMLISPSRAPKQELALGDRKSITTDRVILVPGPAHEVECVREIYRMLISEKRTIQGISQELNRRGVQHNSKTQWDHQAVRRVLTHPKYCGCHVYGRTSSRLNTRKIRTAKSEWILTPDAFEPIIDLDTFEKAQTILASRTVRKSNEDLLNDLRQLLAVAGRISNAQIQEHPEMASSTAYYARFGSLQNAYKLIGYEHPEQFDRIAIRRRTQAFHQQLIARIVAMFPGEVSLITRRGVFRHMLRVSSRFNVSLVVARFAVNDRRRWVIVPVEHERRFVTLLALLNESNDAFLDFHVLPSIDRQTMFRLTRNHPWLKRGARLNDLSRFCKVVARVARRKTQRL